jgi:hypothetical protein
VPPGSTVLAPLTVSHFFPALVPDLLRADERTFRGQFQERRAFVEAFYAGEVSGEELVAALDEFGIEYVLARQRSKAEEALRPSMSYGAGAFEREVGSPDLARRDAGSGAYMAWSLDGLQAQQVGGVTLTVPEDIGADPRVVFEVVVAPSAAVVQRESTRVIVTYLKEGEGPMAAVRTLIDVDLPGGTAAGAWLSGVRAPPRRTLEAGATYRLSVSRQPGGAGDSYDADLWFAALRLRYIPAGLNDIEGTTYRMYEVPK